MSAHKPPESSRGSSRTPQPLLPSAMAYSDLGVSVIPTVKLSKKGAVKWKPFQRLRPDPDQLRMWFADVDNEQLGVAAVLGQVSGGLLCRDFDEPGSYEAWKRSEPRLARALPTLMAFRGPHVYFRCKDYPLSATGTFIRTLGDGEMRGDGHIAVLPPSLHAKSKAPYRWLIEPGNSFPEASLGAFGIEVDPKNVTQGDLCVTVPLPAALPLWLQQYLSEKPFGATGTSGGAILDAIKATLPKSSGQRHRMVFEFIRHLQSIEGVAGLAPDELMPILEYWHQLALPVINTKGFATTEKDFRNGWSLVKTPAGGEGSIKRALERAVSSPLPPEATQFRLPGVQLLVGLCRELQRERGSKPFYLSCRDAAAVLGLAGKKSHMTAWRWLKMLCHSEPVRILHKERSGNQKDKRANEYRYLPKFD